MPIRYALVGLGHIAQVAVLPAFADAARNSVLTALVSGDAAKRASLAARFGVGATFGYDDYERCLAEVDAVYLALPNHLHAEYTTRAAAAGVHVLCEKPLGVTARECAAMIDACRIAGVQLMVAYRLHHDPMTRDILACVRRGDLGSVRLFEALFSFTVRRGGTRTSAPAHGGGTLHDIGVYAVNMARHLFAAEPVEVSALAVPGTDHEADDATAAVLRFDEGRLAVFATSFAATGLGAYRIVGTDGHIRAEPGFAYSGDLACDIVRHGHLERKVFPATGQFAEQILHFSDCIVSGAAPVPPGLDGLRDVIVLEALLTAAASARTVRIAPAASVRVS